MSILERLVGIIAPPECVHCGQEGAALCPVAINELHRPYVERCFYCYRISPGCKTCQKCRKASRLYAAMAATDYSLLVRQLIARYKFTHQRAAAQDIAGVMVGNSTDFISTLPAGTVVVSVPTTTAHIRQRSFNNSVLLAKEVARIAAFSHLEALRRRGQQRQVGTPRRQRLTQLAGTVHVLPSVRPRLNGKSVLLIDDVATTGSTLEECAKVLRSSGVRRVYALVLSHKLLGDTLPG